MKYLFLMVFSLIGAKAIAQPSRFVIEKGSPLMYYTFDSSADFVPVIDELLRELRFGKRADIPSKWVDSRVFSKVSSMNAFQMVEGTIYIMNEARISSDPMKKWVKPNKSWAIDSLLAKALKSHNYFLLIVIKPLASLFEVQFRLFPPAQNSDRVEQITSPDYSNYRTTSVIIDPAKPNYRQELLRGLRQLVTEATDDLQPQILSSSHRIIGDTIFVLTNDTLKLQASANNNDFPEDRIKFWWQLDPGNYNYVLSNEREKDIVFFDSGTYCLDLKASDATGGSPQHTSYAIKVSAAPEIKSIEWTGHHGKPGHYNSMNNYVDFITYSSHSVSVYAYDVMPVGKWNDDKLRFKIKVANADTTRFSIADRPFSPDTDPSAGRRFFPVPLLDPCPDSPAEFTGCPFISSSHLPDSIDLVIKVPRPLTVPSQSILRLSPSYKGLPGEPRDVDLHFYRIRRLFFNLALEWDQRNYSDGAVKVGAGYTVFPLGVKVNICAEAGIFVHRFALADTFDLNNLQEAYLNIPLGRSPLNLNIGIRNMYLDQYSEFNTSRKFKGVLCYLLGLEYSISDGLYRQRVFLNWGWTDEVPFLMNQVSFGLSLDLFSARRK
jgi:hypothetical protein